MRPGVEDAEREVDLGSDVDMNSPKLDDEDDVGMEPEDEEEDDDDDDDEPEPEPEEDTESDELSPPPSPHKPRLKIKLKLPQILSPNEPSSRAASTPSGEPSRAPSHSGISRDIDIESEDEDDEDQVVGGSTRPMTSRQAVLASVVDSSHVSLSESSRKKKQLTESEIALRREETARKRKNLTEKKLEDEKAETINRLLKKQSKSKNKRNVLSTADDRTPISATPAIVQSTRDGSEAPEAEAIEPVELVPTMYRWVSTTRLSLGGNKEPSPRDEADGRMSLMFSVPVSVLPRSGTMTASPQRTPLAETPVCNVRGCGQARKYRLARDWVKGACGMAHLKMLEQQTDVV